MRSTAAAILAQPFRIVDADRFWDKQEEDLFKGEYVRRISRDGAAVVLTVDGTKLSDYEEIVYRLRPDMGWAVEQVVYLSGGREAAKISASEFFSVGPGQQWCPGRIVYERVADETSQGLVRAEAVIAPSKDFDLADAASFRLTFPPDAVSESDIFQRKVERKAIDEVRLQASRPSALSREHAAAPLPAASRATDAGAVPTASTSGAAPSGSSSSIWLLALTLLGLLLTGVLAAVTAKIRRGHRVSFTAGFLGLFCLSVFLAIVAICLQNILYGRRTGAVEGAAKAVSTAAATSNASQGTWDKVIYSELSRREYRGRVNLNPVAPNSRLMPYTGFVERKNGMERHEFEAGPASRIVEIEGDWMRQFSTESQKPLLEGWSPTLYTLFCAYQARTGQRLKVVGESEIDLTAVKFRNLLGKQEGRIILHICGVSEDSLTCMITIEGKPALLATVLWDGAQKRVIESYKYFDVDSRLVFDWESTYTL